MSNTDQQAEANCSTTEGCAAVELIIQPIDKDLGGFSVRRLLPTVRRKKVGPWVFFDHMGPAEFAAGHGINVRPHPHINLATVSYLFEGESLHRDSLGTTAPIRPGDLNLMVAGRGIVHSERERPEVTAVAHRIHGLQLWLALPVADEEIEPAFYHYPSDELPSLVVNGVPLRVMIGTAYGVSSPVRVFADTLYVEAQMQAAQVLAVPCAQERAIYVASGTVKVGETVIPEHAMAVLAAHAEVSITATTEARIAIIGGETLEQRFVEWNFVSSRKARIEQAKADWKAGRFAKVPGDEDEFIPLPE